MAERQQLSGSNDFSHMLLSYNFLFVDGSVRLENINSVWGGGTGGMWDRNKD
ncbi:MAG: hypothetical protein MK132_17650 [Lentisphaerales bacterium]|nr:hypothetical protein [Lentisphaerales bacterium]